MGARCGKLIATDKSSVGAKSLFDPIVVEDGEGNGCFPDSPCTDESNRFEVIGECNDLLNQVVTSKTVPRRRGRQFTQRLAMKL